MIRGGQRRTIKSKIEGLMVLTGREVIKEFVKGLGYCGQVLESP